VWFGLFVVCATDLVVATVVLLGLSGLVRHTSRVTSLPVIFGLVFLGGWAAQELWSLPRSLVVGADLFVAVVASLVVAARPVWNFVGQLFFSAFVAGVVAYLAFAADITVAGHLSVEGALASALLFLLELSALVLASSFVFETCDVVCRVRHSRSFPDPDMSYVPKVSLHIAAYNEPPEMLIETIRSVERIDYPNFELVVIDNNTPDEATWRPVEDYCRGRPGLKFVHVDPWPGYKSGALNLALREITAPDAEIVGVIDADYLVDREYLGSIVGYFSDPSIAFVQTPQDYRDYEGSTYLTACYDAYRYFFTTAMPSRNERDSIIFAGTMGLLRRSLLEEIGGWDEWCITEDAETSLRLLEAGYKGMFVARSFGRGIMPLTFASLKSQRFRWCFGGMQILRRHWRELMPWDDSPENQLSIAQRLDYLFGGLQWMNDLVLLAFSVVLLVMAGLLLDGQSVAIRPLVGPTLALPSLLVLTGLLRAVWALRRRTGVSYRRALLAFASWLSLSFTVARACIQGLTRKEGVFLRTPKTAGEAKLSAALVSARSETFLASLLWGCAVALGLRAHPTPLLLGLFAWQGAVYWTSPWMSWLAQRARLTPELASRRRTEERRERLAAALRPAAIGTSAVLGTTAAVFVAVLALGSAHSGHPPNPFTLPPSSSGSSQSNGPSSTTTTTTPRTTTTSAGNAGVSTTTSTGPRSTTTSSPTTTSTKPGGAQTSVPSSSTTSTTVGP
jgi:glycosyltransferase involved in cell wall biosynthesis